MEEWKVFLDRGSVVNGVVIEYLYLEISLERKETLMALLSISRISLPEKLNMLLLPENALVLMMPTLLLIKMKV